MTPINVDGARQGAPDEQNNANSIVIDISQEVKIVQRATILRALRQGPLTTIDARDRLGISSPASRIFELRKQGWQIATVRAHQFDFAGRPHLIARYVLKDGVKR